jgi:hypothetical protein
MRVSYPCKFSSKMALKNTSMNNQRTHLAKLWDTPLSTLFLFLLKKHLKCPHLWFQQCTLPQVADHRAPQKERQKCHGYKSHTSDLQIHV